MSDYYTSYAVATWEQYVAAGDPKECGDPLTPPENDYYYRMFARHCDTPNQTKAKRGCQGTRTCCEQCSRCLCACSGIDQGGISENITITFSDVIVCSGYPACFAEVNNTWTLPLVSETNCIWSAEFPICSGSNTLFLSGSLLGPSATRELLISAGASGGGAGLFTAGYAPGTAYEITPAWCEAGSTSAIPNDNIVTGCGFPFGNSGYDGSAIVAWSHLGVTPRYYTAVFSGTITPCGNCTEQAVVAAAIEELKNPAGWILIPTLGNSCMWNTPKFGVPGYPGWYWYATLQLVANGTDTQWVVWADIIDYRHTRPILSEPGLSLGQKYACDYDWNTHLFFYAVEDTARYQCNSPPTLANDLACNGHVNSGGGGSYDAKQYSPCAEGGSCELTPTW